MILGKGGMGLRSERVGWGDMCLMCVEWLGEGISYGFGTGEGLVYGFLWF